MPQGLQTFGPDGTLRVDLGDRMLRFLGTIVVGTGGGGALSNDGFLTGTPFCVVTAHSSSGASSWPAENLRAPSVTFSGNTMTYSGFWADHRIHYGVY